MSGLTLTAKDVGLKVVHPNWLGRPLFGTIVHVPNQWHVDVSATRDGLTKTYRAAQNSLMWAQDFKK